MKARIGDGRDVENAPLYDDQTLQAQEATHLAMKRSQWSSRP